jgi:hypothetical protein
MIGAMNDANYNTAMGHNALSALTLGDSNTAIGFSALTSGTSATENTIVGSYAGDAIVGGGSNIMIGAHAGGLLTSGGNNTVVGTNAFDRASLGEEGNVAIGYEAMGAITEHASSSAVNQNVAIGQSALLGGVLASGENVLQNVAVGYQSLYSTGGEPQTGVVAVGAFALNALTSGTNNMAVGYEALAACTTGLRNIAVGEGALKSMTLGDDNIAIGYRAAVAASTDAGFEQNIFIGNYTGDALANHACVGNIAIGHANLGVANNSTCDDNIAIGRGAGDSITSGYLNVLVGKSAGTSITTGNSNVVIGPSADVQNAASVKRIVIGTVASSASDDTTIYIGDNTNYLAYSYASGGGVAISSDERTKQNIRDTDLGLDFINKLRPVKYKMRYPKDWGDGLAGENPEDYGEDYDKADWDGFIAQEVKAVMDSLDVSFCGWEVEGNDNFEKPRQRLAYDQFVTPLVKAVQELSQQNDELKARIEAMENA